MKILQLKKKALTGILFTFFCVEAPALAEIMEYPVDPPEKEQAHVEAEPAGEMGADGTLDPRLPPVIPGEEIVRGGKRYRTWSTAGPVPRVVERDSWKTDRSGELSVDELNVFIDRRRDQPSVRKDLQSYPDRSGPGDRREHRQFKPGAR